MSDIETLIGWIDLWQNELANSPFQTKRKGLSQINKPESPLLFLIPTTLLN